MRSRIRALLIATHSSPSSAASIHPIGPAYHPDPSAPARGSLRGGVARLAAQRRGRVQESGEVDRRPGIRELGVDGRRQVLDIRHPDDLRIRCRLDPHRVRAQRPLDPADDDLVLVTILFAAHELLAQVVVDRGSARRVDPATAAVAATAPLLRTSSSGLAPRNAASGVPTQKQKQDGNNSRRAP